MILEQQDYAIYSEEDHYTWTKLYQRQSKLIETKASKVYLEALNKLGLNHTKVENIKELSNRLESISGWSLIPVSGLIPTRDFFYMLINKKYPVTVYIRKPEEIDFSKNPDIFHDVFGHLPLLTNEKFTKFLTAYSTIAIKYVNNEQAIEFLGRLYWYTYEMGILLENDEYKPYGGAVITSSQEMENMNRPATAKYSFNIDRIFKSAYNPYELQNNYFVIRSFDELFDCIEILEETLKAHLLIREKDHTIRNYPLNTSIGKSFNNVIGFLNDIQYRFPKAISFVAGQPDESFFDIEDNLSKFDVFIQYAMNKTGGERRKVINNIGQYNKTKGIVNDIVAEYLKRDDNIYISPEHILMTVGAQEAFAIIVSTICNRDNDVILVEEPSYIGISSFSRVFNYSIHGVPLEENGINLEKLNDTIISLTSSGKRVKLVYVIPDYQNPSGCSMPIESRIELLKLSEKFNFLIIEDGVYNSFTYAQKRNPTLKSLDKHNRVIYVSSFSKLLFPGLRMGLIAAEQKIGNDEGQDVFLIDEMVKVKAQLTNNTPTINQAILGGILLSANYTLSELNKSKFISYKRKRDKMIEALNSYIKAYNDDWACGIKWNEPDGGFFIKMVLPFDFRAEDVVDCAKRFGVIICPMSNFYLGKQGFNEIRLTFSNISLEEIDRGIRCLASYLSSKVRLNQPAL